MTSPKADGPACYRVTDLARRWACSASTVRNRIATGALPCLRFGTMIRVPITAVDAYEAACLTSRPEAPPNVAAPPADTADTPVARAIRAVREERMMRRLRSVGQRR
jgi:excisionase family DNA binding protein